MLSVQGKHLVVMMSGGAMYSQPVVPECSAVDGPVYLVRELVVGHDQVEVGDPHSALLLPSSSDDRAV